MFRKLVEEIRLEARYGRYGHYDVRPRSNLRRLAGGLGKVAGGAVGLGSLGMVSVGRHPGTDRDAAREKKADDDYARKHEVMRKLKAKKAKLDVDDEPPHDKNPFDAPSEAEKDKKRDPFDKKSPFEAPSKAEKDRKRDPFDKKSPFEAPSAGGDKND